MFGLDTAPAPHIPSWLICPLLTKTQWQRPNCTRGQGPDAPGAGQHNGERRVAETEEPGISYQTVSRDLTKRMRCTAHVLLHPLLRNVVEERRELYEIGYEKGMSFLPFYPMSWGNHYAFLRTFEPRTVHCMQHGWICTNHCRMDTARELQRF